MSDFKQYDQEKEELKKYLDSLDLKKHEKHIIIRHSEQMAKCVRSIIEGRSREMFNDINKEEL